MNERAILDVLRRALRLYYESENRRQETLIEELESTATRLLELISIVIDGLPSVRRVWLANGVQRKLEAGQELGGSYNSWRLWELAALMQAFEDWISQPITVFVAPDGTEVKQAPVTIISRRENPLAMWADVDVATSEVTEGDVV